MRYHHIFTTLVFLLFFLNLSISAYAGPKGILPDLVMIYEDGHRELVRNWTYIYRGKTTTNAPDGMYIPLDIKKTDLLLSVNTKERKISPHQVDRIVWKYQSRNKTKISGPEGEALLESFSVHLRNNEIIQLKSFTPSSDLASSDNGFTLDRVLLVGSSNKKFLEVLSENLSELAAPSDVIVEICYVQRK